MAGQHRHHFIATQGLERLFQGAHFIGHRPTSSIPAKWNRRDAISMREISSRNTSATLSLPVGGRFRISTRPFIASRLVMIRRYRSAGVWILISIRNAAASFNITKAKCASWKNFACPIPKPNPLSMPFSTARRSNRGIWKT